MLPAVLATEWAGANPPEITRDDRQLALKEVGRSRLTDRWKD